MSGWHDCDTANVATYGDAIKLTGTVTGDLSAYKSVTPPEELRHAGQTYIFSGWAKADSAALKNNRSFALKATIRYVDDSTEV